MQKKVIIIFIILILVVFGLFLIRGEAPKPDTPCESPQVTKEKVKIDSPKTGQKITSPLEIKGEARGYWFFEASFPIRLEGNNGKIIAQTIAEAQDDWMTEKFVPFKARLEFVASTSTNGFLVFEKDNPSGLPENYEEVRIPVYIEAGEIVTVKAFFNNDKMDPEFSCNKVFPVERIILRTQAVARAALEELLKGSTEEEKTEGFFTNINSGVQIQSLTINNGIAKVDFDEQLEFQVGGSCRVSAIRAQITQTLKQFTIVKEVVISINGRTEDILQP